MGCANTKAGAVAVEGAPEGGDAQKEVPKVMVDGEDMAVNGNVVNANGIEEGTTGEELKEQTACNGDVTDKRKSKAEGESDIKCNDTPTPSGDAKSNENEEEAKMADDHAPKDAGEQKEGADSAADESRNED